MALGRARLELAVLRVCRRRLSPLLVAAREVHEGAQPLRVDAPALRELRARLLEATLLERGRALCEQLVSARRLGRLRVRLARVSEEPEQEEDAEETGTQRELSERVRAVRHRV